MIADDLAWDDCGAFGNPRVKTPNIDRLARGGMRFDRAFVTASSCSPSRSSLITGCYPHNTDTKIHGVPPAEADMQRYFRVSAPAVHEMVKTLERQGFIAREPGRPRSIRRLLSRAGLPDLG
jgi:arylsulfatase A-like enzyme